MIHTRTRPRPESAQGDAPLLRTGRAALFTVSRLIATKSATNVNYGYQLGAALMIAAGIVAILLAVPAERRSLEEIARPFTAVRDWASVRRIPVHGR